MLFNSAPFIFVFLPVVLLGFHFVCRQWGQGAAVAWLVAASLVFYGYWNPPFVALLAGSIALNFGIARLIAAAAGARRSLLLGLGVAANLAAIAYFRYANLLVESLNTLAGSRFEPLSVVLPLAISFFTFQQIAYLVDVHRGYVPDRSLTCYALFVTFFPQLIAGPIVQHHETAPQFRRFARRGLAANALAVGIGIFTVGLAKKILLGDPMGVYADGVFNGVARGGGATFVEAWLGSIAFGLQIYFDFSGYSDMAVGLARMFGVRLPANFHSPYKAASIIDFWRRWHITLSRFLRDYLYVPLGGNRRGEPRRMANILVVMLLGGLWHGAGWTFVAWGGMHGAFIVVNHLWRRRRGTDGRRRPAGRGARRTGQCLTLLAVTMAWVLFRAEDFDTAARLLRAMCGADGIALPVSAAYFFPGLAGMLEAIGFRFSGMFGNGLIAEPPIALASIAATAAIALFAPNTQTVFRRYRPVLGRAALPHVPWERAGEFLVWRLNGRWAMASGGLMALSVLGLSHVKLFLYFAF